MPLGELSLWVADAIALAEEERKRENGE